MSLVRPPDLIANFEENGKVLVRSVSLKIGAKVPPFAVGVLAYCSIPRSRDEVVAHMGPHAANMYDALAQNGLLLTPEQANNSAVMFHNYTGIEVHRRMLVDEPRLAKYREGLQAIIQPGDVVIDAGSGTGVLAVLAAQAGAAKVYALEQSRFADVIPHVAASSGVGDIVEVVQGDFSKLVLPQKARVLVSETFGGWAFAEDPNPDITDCVANNLLPDGVVVPGSVALVAAPMAEAPHALLGVFGKRDDGIDLSPLLGDARARGHIMDVDAAMCGKPRVVAKTPFPTTNPIVGTLTLDKPCAALCCWFDLEMAPGVTLSTSPSAPWTHWRQSVLPFALDAGEYEVILSPAPEDRRTLLVEIDGHSVRLR